MNDGRVGIIDARVAASIKYFSGVGHTNRILYYSFGATQVGLAVLVPIFALVPGGGEGTKLAAAIAGAATAFVKGLDSLLRTHETWIRASSTVSRLWSERFLFNTTSGKYAGATDRAALYAESVDAILGQETETWVKVSEEREHDQIEQTEVEEDNPMRPLL
jgi:Protein of unknown function (DUF4231)